MELANDEIIYGMALHWTNFKLKTLHGKFILLQQIFMKTIEFLKLRKEPSKTMMGAKDYVFSNVNRIEFIKKLNRGDQTYQGGLHLLWVFPFQEEG